MLPTFFIPGPEGAVTSESGSVSVLVGGGPPPFHIRQTTLSAAVKSVEEELGYPIFQRTPSGVAPTQPGEQFLALAWEIHIKYEELLRLKQRTTEGGPTVRLLLPPSVMSCLSLPLTKRFCQFELRGNLAFEECMSMEVCNRITAGEANLGLTYLTEENLRQYEVDFGAASTFGEQDNIVRITTIHKSKGLE